MNFKDFAKVITIDALFVSEGIEVGNGREVGGVCERAKDGELFISTNGSRIGLAVFPAICFPEYCLPFVSLMMMGHLDKLSLSGVSVATSYAIVTGYSLINRRHMKSSFFAYIIGDFNAFAMGSLEEVAGRI
nr:protein detoxification 7 [Quercus suber]